MNILISTNDLYYSAAKTMLTSLCENNKFENHSIYLLYSNLGENKVKELKQFLARYGATFHQIRVREEDFIEFPTGYHFTIEIYYRLLVQSVMPESVNRILWLDADMIVKSSLENFYYQDFEGKCISVCQSINQDPTPLIEKLELPKSTIYFNSGIILFNLELMRKTVDERIYIDYIQNNSDKLTWPDQDALNVIFQDRKKINDYQIYNMQHFHDTTFSLEMKGFIDQNTVVLHYIGSTKPWNYRFCNYTLKYYRRYASMHESILMRLRFNILHLLYRIKKSFR